MDYHQVATTTFLHCVKSAYIRKFSDTYIPALGRNMGYLSVFCPNAGK